MRYSSPPRPTGRLLRALACACLNFSVMAAGLDMALARSFQPFHPAPTLDRGCCQD